MEIVKIFQKPNGKQDCDRWLDPYVSWLKDRYRYSDPEVYHGRSWVSIIDPTRITLQFADVVPYRDLNIVFADREIPFGIWWIKTRDFYLYRMRRYDSKTDLVDVVGVIHVFDDYDAVTMKLSIV